MLIKPRSTFIMLLETKFSRCFLRSCLPLQYLHFKLQTLQGYPSWAKIIATFVCVRERFVIIRPDMQFEKRSAEGMIIIDTHCEQKLPRGFFFHIARGWQDFIYFI